MNLFVSFIEQVSFIQTFGRGVFHFVKPQVMCMCSGETVDHLLLHCTVTREIWSYVFRLFGVHWVISGSVLDLVVGWRNWFGKQSSEVWNLVPLCVMWSIWRERNNRTFEDIEHFVGQLIESCMCSLYD